MGYFRQFAVLAFSAPMLDLEGLGGYLNVLYRLDTLTGWDSFASLNLNGLIGRQI